MDGRIKRLMRMLPEDVDAALINGYGIRRYYTGRAIPDALLLVSGKSAWMLASPTYRKEAVGIPDVRYVESWDPWVGLSDLLEAEGIRRLAVQADQLTVEEWGRLKKETVCEVVDDGRLDELLYRLNCVKSQEEVEAVARAQDIADRMFLEVLNYVHAGMSDWEVQRIVGVLLRDFGSQWDNYDHVMGVGVNTSMPHVRPNGTIIQPGDFVMLDVGGMVDGYGSDMTRMFAVGYADERKREIYEIVRRAQQAGCEAIEVGKTCCEVDRAARAVIEKAGYGRYYMHGLGHSIGIPVPRGPRFNQTDTTEIFAGLIMTVEPGIYLPGEFGVRIEDMLYISEEGVQNLTHSPRELIVIE